MSHNLKITISNIKNIKSFEMEIPVEQGLHVIAGSNGIRKSTLMALLAVPFRPSILWTLFTHTDEAGNVKYNFDNKEDNWVIKETKWVLDGKKHKEIRLDGFIEGSIIHGTRFTDGDVLELSEQVKDEHLVDADDFINKNFNYILHGKKHYPTIKKIKNTKLATELGFNSVPYFMEYENRRISQFWLSSGENLLLSLLHFLNNKIFQQKRKGSKYISLILIDEVELALHPVAIRRLIEVLEGLSEEFNLSIFFSSHSTELLRSINPGKIYYLQSLPNNAIEIINPCYPAYATRFLYDIDGYDILILCEDELAKYVIKRIVDNEKLYEGKLIHILPCGDWRNTIRLHKEIMESKLTNHTTKIISTLDGDITDRFEEEKKKDRTINNLNVSFLPITSLEKFLHKYLVDEVDPAFFREINDRFFKRKPLDAVVTEYQSTPVDIKGKKLWAKMVETIANDGMTEKEFLREICSCIYGKLNAQALAKRISALF